MNTFDTIHDAYKLVIQISQMLHELSFPDSLRNRLAASCFAVTQEHQHAIVICLQQSPALNAPAFALIRIQYEAYIRGMWISHCATDEEIEEFSNGNEPPKMPKLIEAIDNVSCVEGQLLSKLHKNTWKTMCAYAHTGALQVQRWNTVNGIEPNYDAIEIKEILSFTSTISLLSAISVASLASNVDLAQRLLKMFKITTNNIA